jgi:hypothetical protein
MEANETEKDLIQKWSLVRERTVGLIEGNLEAARSAARTLRISVEIRLPTDDPVVAELVDALTQIETSLDKLCDGEHEKDRDPLADVLMKVVRAAAHRRS